MKFHQDKLDKLECCMKKEKIEEWQSPKSLRKFVEKVLPHTSSPDFNSEDDLEIFCDKNINRCNVRKLIDSKDANALAKVLFILAWGGMTLPNAKKSVRIVSELLEKDCRRYAGKESLQRWSLQKVP